MDRSSFSKAGIQLESSTQNDNEIPVLELGKAIDREIVGGQAHSYKLSLTLDQYVHVVVDRRDIER